MWHRLSVVISVLWVAFVTFSWMLADPPREYQLVDKERCIGGLTIDIVEEDPRWQACEEVGRQEEARLKRQEWVNGLLIGIASLVIIWGLFFMVRLVVRWVLAGRNPA